MGFAEEKAASESGRESFPGLVKEDICLVPANIIFCTLSKWIYADSHIYAVIFAIC